MGASIEMQLTVLRAGAPGKWPNLAKKRIELAYRDPAGRLHCAVAKERIPEERWIVAGMTIAALVDPDRPEKAEVDVERIPPLEERIRNDDRALCDLETVRRQVSLLRREIAENPGRREHETHFEEELREEVAALDQAHHEEDLAEMLAARPAGPVHDADGRLRGTADFVSRTSPPPSPQGEAGPPRYKGRRLYRVWPYGHAPYPVLDEVTFNTVFNRDRATLGGGHVPVSVSTTDRTDVRFLWDEYDFDFEESVHQKVLTSLDRAGDDAVRLQQKALEGIFAALPDPAQRRMVADQMRAMGQEVPAHLLVDPERLAKLDALLARGVITQEEYDQQAGRR